MAPKAQKSKRAPAAVPLIARKQDAVKKVTHNHLFEKKAKNFRIGGDVQPRRDLTRYVKWPRCVRLQRQKRILMTRLKIPPTLNQFSAAIDRNQASQLLRLLSKYKPETRAAKKERLMEIATAKEAGQDVQHKKPHFIKHGLNHVTTLIENKLAKMVIIAHDVDPIELVCWLPTLCRKKDIPYCIIKSKARLGQLVHMKTASCVALTSVRKEDQAELEALAKNFKSQFNDNTDLRRRWGGGIVGRKSQHVIAAREKMLAKEAAKKMGLQI